MKRAFGIEEENLTKKYLGWENFFSSSFVTQNFWTKANLFMPYWVKISSLSQSKSNLNQSNSNKEVAMIRKNYGKEKFVTQHVSQSEYYSLHK